MNGVFDWIEPYRLIAEKLLDFKNDRAQLLKDLHDIYDEISLKYPFIDNDKPMTDIDPFSVFATFNRGLTDINRKDIIKKLIEKWNIKGTVPSSFDGIPIVNNMQSWFVAGVDRREADDIANLWNLFESSLNLSSYPDDTKVRESFVQYFDKVRNQRVVSYKITFGLFWISPETFLNLDRKTRELLLKHELINRHNAKHIPDGEGYLKICSAIKSDMTKPPINANSFPELSYIAYSDTDDLPNTGSSEDSNQYLWINFSPKLHGIIDYNQLLGETFEYFWGEKGKATVRRISASSKLKPGDKAILVDIEPNSGIFAEALVTSPPHKPNDEYYQNKYPDSYVFDLKITDVFEKTPRDIIYDIPSFEGVSLKSLLKAVSINTLSKEQYDALITYVKEETDTMDDTVQKISFDQSFNIESLYFEDKEQIERQIHTALIQGKNIIFTGPPGTGKSKLAKEVADFYQADFKMVTASSHWSTYETLGGYHPNKHNELEFKPGLFLTCVKDTLTNDNINQWLIIDELNRADIDKAFGSFFSVVTGDTVSLPFEADNNQLIRLMPETSEKSLSPQEHVYVYPKDWRLIATMNTADKSSLFELSYAFMRRFAFINIGVPKSITPELVQHYLTAWGIEGYAFASELAQIWSLINTHRKMGPAIIEDIATYTVSEPNFTDALLLYVMPQLEGMLREDINSFIDTLKQEVRDHIDSNVLNDFVEDFFGDAL